MIITKDVLGMRMRSIINDIGITRSLTTSASIMILLVQIRVELELKLARIISQFAQVVIRSNHLCGFVILSGAVRLGSISDFAAH